METSNIVVSIILSSFCALPVVLIYFNRKKTTRILTENLTKLAQENQCEIHEFEINQDIIIGMDKTHNFLFFARRKVNDFVTHQVNLNLIERCKVVDRGTKVTQATNTEKRIERLDLEFEAKHPNTQKQIITFYDEDENFSLNGEVQLINKWASIVNQTLKEINNVKSKAKVA